jgi:hypothetical protein
VSVKLCMVKYGKGRIVRLKGRMGWGMDNMRVFGGMKLWLSCGW